MTEIKGLTDNQRAFVKAKLNNPGHSVRKLAEMIGVSEDTAYRYNTEPAVRQAMEEAHEEAKAVIQATRLKASLELAKLITSDKEAIKIRAIEMVLGMVLKDPGSGAKSQGGDTPLEAIASRTDEEWAKIFRTARGLSE